MLYSIYSTEYIFKRLTPLPPTPLDSMNCPDFPECLDSLDSPHPSDSPDSPISLDSPDSFHSLHCPDPQIRNC